MYLKTCQRYRLSLLAALFTIGAGCASGSGPQNTASLGGATTSGGTSSSAGTTASGGTTSVGGITSSGGTTGSGGTTAGGGTTIMGGMSSNGGTTSTTGGTGGSVVVNGGTGSASFHCVNWGDTRDNFVDGHLLLAGITSDTDTYAGVTTKADLVLGAFTDILKANSFRMPINEPTALDSWWNSYKAIIDVGIAKGMKVVISFWAKDKSIGMPVDVTRWYSMWKVVTDAYVSNPLVYYDIHNEPHGYTTQAWIAQVAAWIAQFPNVPRKQIIVAGSGWDDNVASVAPSFPDLMMEVHDYAFNNTSQTSVAAWTSDVMNRLGNASSRTIVGEWAATVTGVDYSTGVDGNNDKSFVVGVADAIHDNNMGSCWWTGLWNPVAGEWSPAGTTPDLLLMQGTGNNLTFTIQGQSALNQVWHSWGLQ